MANPNILEFTNENWQQEVVQSDKPVLVDFWAPWCGPCRQLTPIIERLADRYAGKLKVGKLNVDDHQELAIKYAITNIPRIYLFRGGDEPRERVVGLTSENELAKLVDRVLEA